VAVARDRLTKGDFVGLCTTTSPLGALAADRREATADEADGAPRGWR
jgi:hypothetical protein